MKHFLALPALLRTSALLALASQHSFSVHDDLLAFPQYELHFVDDWTPADQVASKLATNTKESSSSSDRSEDAERGSQLGKYQQPLHHGTRHDAATTADDHMEYEHERMMLDGQPWLCRIPKVKPTPEPGPSNETLSKAEEEKELARANERGWELLSGMEGNCVYFISGWWSYRFCYNQGIKQFHQLPPSRGVPIYPPMEDPGVPGFMLGTYAKRLDAGESAQEQEPDSMSALEKSEGAKRSHNKHGELVQRGESRYLVQKLGGGTICDLTGKERKIEVQYFCNPASTDRIALIKETSTCAYLMVIQTPRLCNDVAFLPPQKDQPNSISCSPVLEEDEVEDYERDLKALKSAEEEAKIRQATEEAAAAMAGTSYEAPLSLVGDIFVGGRQIVPEGVKIEKSAIVGGGKETYVDTLADSEGKTVSEEELKKLGLSDSKALEKLKKELEKIAQGQAWKLDVIDTPRGREYRGIIGDELDGEEEQNESEEGSTAEIKDGEPVQNGKKEKEKEKQKQKEKEKQKEKKQKQKQKEKTKPKAKEADNDADRDDNVQAGSEEEFFNHDEL